MSKQNELKLTIRWDGTFPIRLIKFRNVIESILELWDVEWEWSDD